MKKLSKNALAFLLVMSFMYTGLNAQSSSVQYDLSQFKLPYLKRQTLETDFSLNGNSDRNTNLTDNGTDQGTDRNIQRRFALDFYNTYTYYLNTEKFQVQQSAMVSLPDFSFSGITNLNQQETPGGIIGFNKSRVRNSTLSPGADYSGEFRNFIQPRLFLELDAQLSYQYTRDRNFTQNFDVDDEITNDEVDRNVYHSWSSEINLLAGRGRIERVEDARLAVYILDDLKKAGRLTREVNEEDITRIAETISVLQNERFFDNREKQIWELQQIDSLLNLMKLVEPSDMVYFSHLKDNWDYAAGPARSAGFQVAGGLHTSLLVNSGADYFETNDYIIDDNQITQDSKNRNRDLAIGPMVRIRYEDPLSLFWQLSVQNTTLISYTGGKTRTTDNLTDATNTTNDSEFYFSNRVNASLSYYPNSRTSMTFYGALVFGAGSYTDNNDDKTSLLNISGSLGANIQYYVSRQIRIFAEASILFFTDGSTYQPTDFASDNNRIRSSLRTGITYKFW